MPKRNKWALEDIQFFRGQELEEDDEGAEAEPIEQVKPPAPPRLPPVGPVVKPTTPAQAKPTPGAGPEELYHTLEEWEDLLRTTGIQPQTPEQFAARQPAVPSMPQIPSFAPEMAEQVAVATTDAERVTQSLLKLFPQDETTSLENVAFFANERPREFLQVLQGLGQSPEAENVLRAIAPDITPQQMESFWTPISAEAVTAINPITHEISPPETKGKDIWDAFRLAATELGHKSKMFFLSDLPDALFKDVKVGDFRIGTQQQADMINTQNKVLRNLFRSTAVRAKAEHEDWLEKHTELQPKPEWTEGAFRNPALLKDPAYWAYEFASTAPFMIAAMGTTVAVSAVAGPGAGVLAGMAVMTPSQAHDMRRLAIENGVPEDDAAVMGLAVGTLMSGVEVAGDLPLLKMVAPKLFGIIKKEVSETVMKATVRQMVRKGVRTFGAVEVTETLEEVAQQAIQNAALKSVNSNVSLLEDLSETAVRAAIATAPLAVFGGGAAISPQVRQAVNAGIQKIAPAFETTKLALADQTGAIKIPGAEPGEGQPKLTDAELLEQAAKTAYRVPGELPHEQFWNTLPGYRQAEIAQQSGITPRMGKIFWKELTEGERKELEKPLSQMVQAAKEAAPPVTKGAEAIPEAVDITKGVIRQGYRLVANPDDIPAARAFVAELRRKAVEAEAKAVATTAAKAKVLRQNASAALRDADRIEKTIPGYEADKIRKESERFEQTKREVELARQEGAPWDTLSRTERMRLIANTPTLRDAGVRAEGAWFQLTTSEKTAVKAALSGEAIPPTGLDAAPVLNLKEEFHSPTGSTVLRDYGMVGEPTGNSIQYKITGKNMKIEGVTVWKEADKRKGIGTQLYLEVLDRARAKNLTITSDLATEEGAAFVRGLVDKGIITTDKPPVKMSTVKITTLKLPEKGVAPAAETTEDIEATVEALEKKWRNAKARNSTRAGADLDALEAREYDVEEAKDALQAFKDIVREDFDTAEEFSEARTEAWDEFIDSIGSISKEVEEAAVAVEPAAPAAEGAAEAAVPEKAEAPPKVQAPERPPPTKPPAPPVEPTPAEPGDSAKWFADYLADPSREKGAELQKQIFRQERAKRFQALVPRTEELIASGLDVEQAFNQARQEVLTGELPRVTTDFFDEMTARARNDLFAKVQETLKDEPTELTSTMQALTNALLGQEIPREVGTGTKAFPEGGSALKRLQRVFPPEQLAAIKKLGKAKKTLHEIAETVWREPTDVGSAVYPGALGLQGDLLETLYPSEGPSAIQWAKRYIETSRSEYEARVKAAREKYEAELEGFYKRYETELEAWQKIPIWERTQAQQFELAFEPTGEGMTALEWAKKNIAEAQERYQRELQEMERQYQEQLEKGWIEFWKWVGTPKATDIGATQMPMIPAPQRNMIVAALKEAGLDAIDIGNFLRANRASFDLSFWRQQAPLIMNNKRSFITANIEAWKAFWNQKAADASWERITRDPLYQYYAQQGYDFLRPLKLPPGTAKWRGTEEFGYLSGERPIPRFTEKIPHVKMSQRGFITGTNEHNWAIFKQFYAGMLKVNEKYASGEIVAKEGEAFSINFHMDKFNKMLSEMTGRAELGKAGTIAPALSAVAFAPRLALGRLLTPRHLISSSKYVRAEAWKNLATFVGVNTAVLLLGKALGLWDVEDDERSADYMNLRIGNTRIDVWGGYKQYVVLAARIITKTGIASDTGQEFTVNPLDALTRFARGKASPLAAILMEFMTGKTFINEDVDIKNPKQWIEHIAPFAAMDIYEAFMDDPMIGALSIVPAMLGAGVATYTGDWVENFRKLGLPKYTDNLPYGLTEPRYDTKDFWADTASQFKGVDPKTLTKEKAYPDYVRSMAEAQVTLGMLDQMPNQGLASINTDPSKGPTFREYYKMWQDRQKLLGDEEALKKFDQDERTRNAQLGNMTQREFALLNQYHLLSKDKQKDFLKEHPELAVNPRTDWLKKHPKENAQLAIWGQAKVLSMEAYKETQRLLKDLDIPDGAIPEFTLPPEKSVETHFKYEDMAEGKQGSWEAQLLLKQDALKAKDAKTQSYADWKGLKLPDTPIASLELKTIPKYHEIDDKLNKEDAPGYIGNLDDKVKDANGKTARDRARAELMDTKIPGTDLTYRDVERKTKAIEKGTDENPVDPKIVDAYVAHQRMADAPDRGPSSAESMLDRVDNPALDAFLTDENIWEKDALKPIDQSKIPGWRIDKKYRKEDAEYQAILDKYEGRDETAEAKAYLAKNADYRKDRRRREAYGLSNPLTGAKFPVAEVGNYVEYSELSLKGKRRDRMLAENPGFARAMHDIKGTEIPDPKTIPSVQYDDIYDQHKEKFDEWDAVGDVNQPDKYKISIPDKTNPNYTDGREYAREQLFKDSKFAEAYHRREAYHLLLDKVTPKFIEDYVTYQKYPDAGMERELHFAENPDFEKALWTARYPKADPADFRPSSRTSNTNIPDWPTNHIESLRISVKYKSQDAEWKAFADPKSKTYKPEGTARDTARANWLAIPKNREYARARYLRIGYDGKVLDKFVPNFADHRVIPEKGMARERYMQRNMAFYDYTVDVLGWEPIPWKTVWSEDFENFWDKYQNTPPGAARKQLRWNNKEMDEEGERVGKWQKLDREPGGLSASDKKLQEWWDSLSKMKLTPIKR